MSSALLLLMTMLVSQFVGRGFAQSEKITLPVVPDAPRVLAFSITIDDKYQQITVIDPDYKSIAVYRVPLNVAAEDVKVLFCASRNIRGDLQLTGFNLDSDALPAEIQLLYRHSQ
jgi:hypothetical protein